MGACSPNASQPLISSLSDENARVLHEPDSSYCLSWRVGVEANNVRYFHTVPAQCISYIENYMLGGQYDTDVEMVVEQVFAYLSETAPSDDGKDAWALDVDDTCISNLMYYESKHIGNPLYRGMGAASFKSAIRKELIAEGYRIRGNIGDQWSDLLGDCVGDHTFKLPNPMYFVP